MMNLTAFCKYWKEKPGVAKQTRKIMKLITFFLLAACLQVSANGFSQKVTIKENNMSLQRVFAEIRIQTGYQFIYVDEVIRTAKPVSLSVKNEKLVKVLDRCFEGQQLTDTI